MQRFKHSRITDGGAQGDVLEGIGSQWGRAAWEGRAELFSQQLISRPISVSRAQP